MFEEFIKPELLVLVPVLYLVGVWLKQSWLNDCHIPLVLGIISVSLCLLWVGSLNAVGVFTAVTQGMLCAGGSVYVHQIVKQYRKKD